MLAGNIGSLSAADTETKNVTYCGCHLQPQEPYYPYYGQGFQQKYKSDWLTVLPWVCIIKWFDFKTTEHGKVIGQICP